VDHLAERNDYGQRPRRHIRGRELPRPDKKPTISAAVIVGPDPKPWLCLNLRASTQRGPRGDLRCQASPLFVAQPRCQR